MHARNARKMYSFYNEEGGERKIKEQASSKKNAVEEEIGKMKAWKATQLESCMNTALKNAEAFEAKAEKLVVVKFIMEAQI